MAAMVHAGMREKKPKFDLASVFGDANMINTKYRAFVVGQHFQNGEYGEVVYVGTDKEVGWMHDTFRGMGVPAERMDWKGGATKTVDNAYISVGLLRGTGAKKVAGITSEVEAKLMLRSFNYMAKHFMPGEKVEMKHFGVEDDITNFRRVLSYVYLFTNEIVMRSYTHPTLSRIFNKIEGKLFGVKDKAYKAEEGYFKKGVSGSKE